MRLWGRFLGAAAMAAFLAAALADGIEVVDFVDTEQEGRYMELIDQLRCLVCQNQTIAESNADLAADMRKVVKQKVVDGQSNEQIVDFLAARYGDFVRYNPPVVARTVVLWFAPFVLAIAAFMLVPKLANRRRRRAAVPESEQAKAKRILAE